MTVNEEYELIPLNPIRRLEKRMENMEASGMGADMIKELMNVVRTNQQVVDDVVRINSQMIGRISDLSNNVSELSNKLNDFISRLEVQGEEKKEETVDNKTAERLDKMEKRLNTLLVAMSKKRVAPMQSQMAQRQAVNRTMLPGTPLTPQAIRQRI